MSSVASQVTVTARVLWVVACVIVLASRAPAAPPGDIPQLDHFRCYSIILGAVSAPENVFVQLRDQFDPALQEFVVGFNLRFCNPVAKTRQGPGQGMGQTTDIIDPNAHLVMYRIHARSQSRATRKVSIDNQFGRQGLTVHDAAFLAVPTQKIEGRLGPPEGLDHFKCYEADGASVNAVVTLDDQFESTLVNVLDPELFCNPVLKIFQGNITEITDEEAHLTCYDIAPAGNVSLDTIRVVAIDNQLVPAVASQLRVVTDQDLLCVPTQKRSWFGFPGSFKAKE